MSTDPTAAAAASTSLPDRCFHWVVRLGDRSSPVPVLAIVATGMIFTQLGRTIHDTDIFWQLKIGELTLAHGLPVQEPFLAGKESEPLAVVAWLAQVIYAAVRQLGGWSALWLVDALVWFAGFAVVAWNCSRMLANLWPVAIGLWVGWFGAVPTASVRPQSFSALAFGLLIVLLRTNLSVIRTSLLGGLLFVVWQNLHPSVVVGGLAITAASVGETVQYFRRNRDSLPWRLFVLLPIAALATVATPAGFDIYRISKLNAEMSMHLNVAEWMPMTWKPRESGRAYSWAAFAITGIMMVLRCRTVRAGTLAVAFALTAASLYSHRFVLFWGIAVIPLWCEMLGTERDDRLRPSQLRRLASAVALSVGIGLPCAMNPAPFASYYPFEGVRVLKASGVHGTVFTTYYWGGLVAEAGHPEWRITHDGRYYLHSREEWDRYFDETYHGENTSLDTIVAKYRPDAFFLRPGSDDWLIRMLERDPGWKPIFKDKDCAVYVPTVPVERIRIQK